jgi:signal transduction histidine kinase/CheY-like chemotaxis protein/methylphosphotriester-DNA--protein-cysteine methyltransferase
VLGGYRWRVRRLRHRQAELQSAVDERTRALKARTEELAAEKKRTERQAERLAELDEAKSRFFAHVSHELRTPLSLIFSPLRDAARRKEGLSPDQVGRMLPSAERLRRLIDRLLDLASLEAGGMELDRRPVDLAALVERTAETFRSEADRDGIDLTVDRPDAGLPIRLDAEKVETIVSNLIANALKHMPESGSVTVRLRHGAAPDSADLTHPNAAGAGPAACIEVADTGLGIPEVEQKRIFDQFTQGGTGPGERTGEQSRGSPGEGLGLGLALTQELAELHGGAVGLDSAPGEGSTFRVWLPLVPVDADEGTATDDAGAAPTDRFEGALLENPGGDGLLPSEAAAPSGDRPAVRTGGAEILIAEDNDRMRTVLREQLSTHWAVREAAGGEAAWTKIQEAPPDLVLSDVMMPGLGGFELCERIKSDSDLRAVPVVLLTARTAEEDTLEGLGAGADDYVAKPFDPAELIGRLDNHLAACKHLRERHRSEVRVEPIETVVEEEDVPFVQEVVEAVEAQLGDPGLTTDRLADSVALSRRQLTRRLKDAVGQAPAAFVRTRRIERAKELLREGPETIGEVAYAVGFRSPSSFSRTFREETGRTPTEYIEENGA